MRRHFLCLFVSLFGSTALCVAAELHEVASFPDKQLTGVAISKTGRVFVNFPHWSDDHTISVAEIIDGAVKAFPDEEWNKPGPAPNHFICVQSVHVDGNDFLWILDPASPKMQGAVKDGPKLVKVDLATNKSIRTILFDESIAPAKSYLNDVRVDPNSETAYITESGVGAIVVVDLKTGSARRLFDGHKSTRAEPEVKLIVDGKELLDQQKRTPQIHADGIALDLKNEYLYYHALTGRSLYRIKTQYLRDTKLEKAELESKVEKVVETPVPDGMLAGPEDSIYLTAIEQNAIVRWNPPTNKVDTIIADKRLSWPDSLSWGPGGALYVACSQIQHMPRFNERKSTRVEPYKVFKITNFRP